PSDDGCDATDMSRWIPPNQGGIAMTSFGDGTAVLVAGLAPVKDAALSSFAVVLDLTKGETWSNVDALKLPEGRAYASATPFGRGALVAGGVDPSDPADPTGEHALDTALVFAGGIRENDRIDLGNRARAHHGAIELASGETLLVGGTNGGIVLSSLVAIDPVTKSTRVFGLGELRQGRKDPVVVRLADNRVLVGGGTDQNGDAVGALEWFASDGSACAPLACPDASSSLPARADVALVALPAGGALAASGDPLAPGNPFD